MKSIGCDNHRLHYSLILFTPLNRKIQILTSSYCVAPYGDVQIPELVF